LTALAAWVGGSLLYKGFRLFWQGRKKAAVPWSDDAANRGPQDPLETESKGN
jgi:hypothetical protein